MTVSPFVLNITAAAFQQDVIERSMKVPVVIDLWAPWCGPCRQLTPILEKLATEYNGRFILGKVNTDEEQQLAAAFRVQSIPFVVAFVNGQPVDQFMGVLPEAQIREWIDALMPSPAQQLLQDGLAIEESDPRTAEGKYREALQLEPDADMVRTRLAKVLLLQNRFDECRSILDELKRKNVDLDAESARIESELDVRQAALETGGVDQARQAAEADPNNVAAQIAYADALAAAQQHRKALELLLGMVLRDKAGAGVDAKATMLKVFDMLGPSSELTSEYRRKLSTALY